MYPEASLKRTIPARSIVLEDPGSFSWGLAFLLLFTLFLVGRIQEVVPALGSVRAVLISGGLAALFWLLAPGSFQDKIPMRTPQVKYVVWLFLLAVLLVPVSVWPGNSLAYIVGAYWKTVLFFLMVVFWARSVVDMRRIIWASCLGVSALVLSGVASGAAVERFHAGSISYDANDLAFVIVIALPLMVYLFSISRLPLKVLVSGMIFISLYGVVLTQSRGGFLALVVVGLLILLRSRGGMATKVGIIALALVVFGSLAGVHYWDRMFTILADDTGTGRTEVWKTGLGILVTHPWGVGIDNFTIAEGMVHGGFGKWNTAHNSFLQLAVELGIVGFFVFIVLITATIRDLWRIQATPEEKASPKTFRQQSLSDALRVKGTLRPGLLPLANALETSLLGFVIGGFFLSQAYSPLLYCILALSLACKRMVREPLNTAVRKPFWLRNAGNVPHIPKV